MSFILQYARPAPPEPVYKRAVHFDPDRQLLVFTETGDPVCEDVATLREMGTTTSTAGSKTHFDD
jgi:putative ATP-grasp target RiPP